MDEEINEEIICITCGCRVIPYRDVEGYVSITSDFYLTCDSWYCPLCDCRILC